LLNVCLLVARLAKEKIEPHVKEMEKRQDILPEIKQLMFDNGVSLTFCFCSMLFNKYVNKQLIEIDSFKNIKIKYEILFLLNEKNKIINLI